MTKVIEYFNNFLKKNVPNWIQVLIEGGLHQVEQSLFTFVQLLLEQLEEMLLHDASKQLYDILVHQARLLGCSDIVERNCTLILPTGKSLKVKSPYVKRLPDHWSGRSRHLLKNHWKIVHSATPLTMDHIGYSTPLAPSFAISKQLLERMGCDLSTSYLQSETEHLANLCAEVGEENIQVEEDESLAGKRVVIGVDGGRTRIRERNEGEVNNNGNKVYETEWREPKLFVIHVLDEKGKIIKEHKPIYGCRFAKDDVIALLKSYLKKLDIKKAQQVQVVADGARWIWNEIKPLLLSLEVEEKKIVETLDYYHARSYVFELIDALPKRVSYERKQRLLKLFKKLLYMGKSKVISLICNTLFKRKPKAVNRCITYLQQNEERMKYTDYKSIKLLSGSGIVESAIRRVINLRFKNTSTFWHMDQVEKMYLLRSAVLTQRWDILIRNVSKSIGNFATN